MGLFLFYFINLHIRKENLYEQIKSCKNDQGCPVYIG